MSGGGGGPKIQKPKKEKLPPKADPAPTPLSIKEGADIAGEAEQRAAKRRKGRRSLILTEQGLGDVATQEPKKSLLA